MSNIRRGSGGGAKGALYGPPYKILDPPMNIDGVGGLINLVYIGGGGRRWSDKTILVR